MNSQLVVAGQPGKCQKVEQTSVFLAMTKSPVVTMVTIYFQSFLQLQRLPQVFDNIGFITLAVRMPSHLRKLVFC